jgi:hypothetical protein
MKEMKDGVQPIIRLRRPADRFRLLTIDDSAYESVPWINAGRRQLVVRHHGSARMVVA